MVYLGLLLIFICGFDLFYLMPGYHIRGLFRVSDLGLLLTFLMAGSFFVRSQHRNLVANPVALMVIAYLFLTLIQVVSATYNYHQPIMSGLIQSRHQFYYLSYFVFLLALDTDEKVEKFMGYMMKIAIFIVIISVINYFGPTLFHHPWAEGHGIRSGIKRAFLPAMNIIGLAFIWWLTRYVARVPGYRKDGYGVLLMFAALLFRQTRGRVIAATLASFWIFFREGRMRLLVGMIVAALLGGGVMAMILGENILVGSFETAYTDVTEEEGTWVGRIKQIENSLETFLEHPWIGTGARFIRQQAGVTTDQKTLEDAYQGDLGWPHWLKNYGILGTVWVIALTIVVLRKSAENRRKNPSDVISRFAEYNFIHIMIGMMTINYLVKVDGILVLCLGLAMLHRRVTPESNIEIGPKVKHPQETDSILRRKRSTLVAR